MRKFVVYFPSFCSYRSELGGTSGFAPISINSFHTSVIYRPLLFKEDTEHTDKVGQLSKLRKRGFGSFVGVDLQRVESLCPEHRAVNDESDIPRGKHRFRATDPLCWRCRR